MERHDTSPSQRMRDAERRNYEQYEQDTARRVGELAWKSFTQEGVTEAPKTAQGLFSRGDPANTLMMSAQETTKTPEASTSELPIPDNWLLEGYEVFGENADRDIKRIGESEDQAINAMRKLIGSNLLTAARTHSSLMREESNLNLILRNTKQKDHQRHESRQDVERFVYRELRGIAEERTKLASQTPESYTLVHGLEFRERIKQVQAGEMATTPYVQKHLDHVENNISTGRPTFLHGHLGSGKTELAINAAKNAAVNKAAYEEALSDLHRFREQNPEASAMETRTEFGRDYRRHQEQFKQALKNGDSAAHKRFDPLIISGSKDLTSQDLFADKTLKLTKFNGKPLLEHKKDLDAEIEKWRSEHPEEAHNPEEFRKAANEILELYKLKNQAFGTEVETIKQAVYRGVEEGRPVIIDEINAIPAAILISLNDVLQRRPGDNCYIPGVGPTKIRPGFALVMTGNLASNGVNYDGTGDLNPAFLSRLDNIEHDYLPMSINDPNCFEQLNPKQNELFHVTMAYLADQQGNLRLPEMDKSLMKLFSLCQLARETQLVFEGKWQESNSIATASGDELRPNLEKSVLSVRSVLRVLEKWNKGAQEDLDQALWDGFIANITEGDDQNFVLALAKRYGFFSEQDGWKVEIKERGAPLISLREAHPGDFNFEQSPLETYSVRKVVELLYGPGPEREVYPEEIDFDTVLDEVDEEISIDDFERYNSQLEEVKKTIAALEVLGGQCGCRINTTYAGA